MELVPIWGKPCFFLWNSSPFGESLVFLEGARPHLGKALLFLREHVPTYGKLFYYLDLAKIKILMVPNPLDLAKI